MFHRGLVIGKFYPPHLGHHFLINEGIRQCHQLTVIVCEKADDRISGSLRAAWIKEIHPEVHVLVIEDIYDPDDSRVWAANTIRWMGSAPDIVFSSEDYGSVYAGLMGSQHCLVDKARKQIPCSGTMIRSDPYRFWEFLSDPVRAFFVKRVCILGAESTGTTTLARDLAEAFQTLWVPEYGREFYETKLRSGPLLWRSEDFVHIAEEQMSRENEMAKSANKILVCDTNGLATKVWHRRYLNTENDRLNVISQSQKSDLYILTGDEIPFVQDGYRDGEAIRHEMHHWFEEELRNQSTPWITVRGANEERLALARAEIDRSLSKSIFG